jgi:hypothetical protein
VIAASEPMLHCKGPQIALADPNHQASQRRTAATGFAYHALVGAALIAAAEAERKLGAAQGDVLRQSAYRTFRPWPRHDPAGLWHFRVLGSAAPRSARRNRHRMAGDPAKWNRVAPRPKFPGIARTPLRCRSIRSGSSRPTDPVFGPPWLVGRN